MLVLWPIYAYVSKIVTLLMQNNGDTLNKLAYQTCIYFLQLNWNYVDKILKIFMWKDFYWLLYF